MQHLSSSLAKQFNKHAANSPPCYQFADESGSAKFACNAVKYFYSGARRGESRTIAGFFPAGWRIGETVFCADRTVKAVVV